MQCNAPLFTILPFYHGVLLVQHPVQALKPKQWKVSLLGGATAPLRTTQFPGLLVSEDLHFAFCRLLLGGSWLPPLHAPESSLVCSLRRLVIGRGYLNECNKDRKDSKQVSLHCGGDAGAVSSNKTLIVYILWECMGAKAPLEPHWKMIERRFCGVRIAADGVTWRRQMVWMWILQWFFWNLGSRKYRNGACRIEVYVVHLKEDGL